MTENRRLAKWFTLTAAVALSLCFLFTLIGCAGSKVWTEQEIQNKYEEAKYTIRSLENCDYESVISEFGKALKERASEEQVKEYWDSIHGNHGMLSIPVSQRSEIADNKLIVITTAKFAFNMVDIRITYGLDRKITEIKVDLTRDFDDGKPLPEGLTEETVIVKTNDVQLPGKLTLPKNKTMLPAVVIVHGLGGLDMDGTVNFLKPYRDIAWGLAQNGIAVLRYDKRTLVYSKEMADDSYTVNEEIIADAVSAVSMLRSDTRIDPDRVYITGHNIGGMMLPRIQEQAKANGLIFLAASARSVEDQIDSTNTNVINRYRKKGYYRNSEEAEDVLRKIHVAVDLIKLLREDSVITRELILGFPKSYWLDLKNYNPVEAAKDITVPLLFLQGERDFQVTMEDLSLWKQLGKSRNIVYKTFKTLGHLFVWSSEDSTPLDYRYASDKPLDAEVIQVIANFILRAK